MELKLENGRYVPDCDGRLSVVTGADELAQRVMMKLAAKRGAFAPRPDYGSRIRTLLTAPPAQRQTLLRGIVYEALADESGLTLTRTSLETEDGVLKIGLEFACTGAGFSVELGLEEE